MRLRIRPGAPPSSPAAQRPSNAQPEQQTIPSRASHQASSPGQRSGYASAVWRSALRQRQRLTHIASPSHARLHTPTTRSKLAAVCSTSTSPPSPYRWKRNDLNADIVWGGTRESRQSDSRRGHKLGAAPSRHSPTADQSIAALDEPCALPPRTLPTCLPHRRARPQSPCPARTRATTTPMHSLCACRTRCCWTRLHRRRRRRAQIWLRCDHRSPRNRAPCPCRDVGWRFGRRKRNADAVGTTALPFVVLDVESGAGGDELLDHRRVALRRGPDERGVPDEKSVAALNSVRPMQSAQRPYPSLPWTSSPAPPKSVLSLPSSSHSGGLSTVVHR